MAASFTVTWVINSPNATAADFTAAPGPFTAPLPAGTLLGTVAITPSDWSGSFIPTGADAPDLVVVPSGTAGVYNVQTVGVLSAGSYSVVVDVAP